MILALGSPVEYRPLSSRDPELQAYRGCPGVIKDADIHTSQFQLHLTPETPDLPARDVWCHLLEIEIGERT